LILIANGVYDRSDIDGSKIVWARDMEPEKNQELIAYYRGRQFWIVHADSAPPHLGSYREVAH